MNFGIHDFVVAATPIIECFFNNDGIINACTGNILGHQMCFTLVLVVTQERKGQ